MKLIKILKSKQGIAIESAIVFMLIIFTLCALLTTLTLFGHSQAKFEEMILQQDVEIDKIGEEFLTYLASTEKNKSFPEFPGYNCVVNGNTLTVVRETDGNVMLYVEAECNNEGKCSVIVWRYSLPPDRVS